MIAISFKNKYWKWIMAVCFVFTLYSSSYFYYRLPSSDAHFFRGLTENLIRTKNLDPSLPLHSYYQWPSFFILANTVTQVSGLEIAGYEFMLFTIIGFLLATTLYVYASKAYVHGSFLAVVAFFIVMFYFLNYQAVPFSLALGLLFLLFMLETREKSGSVMLTILVLYVSISIMHAFVPLFFVLYLLMRSILSRSKRYLGLSILTLMIYFSVQFTLAQYAFSNIVISITRVSSEYSSMVDISLKPVTIPIDVIAQTFSRIITIAFAIICFAGFVVMVIKGRLRKMDKAIFLTGAVYSISGIVLYTLGSRAIAIASIPISLGTLYLYESKLKPYLKYSILILLFFVVSIPIHTSFGGSSITFQTKEAQTTANFIIEKYPWNLASIVISDLGAKWYISPQIQGHTEIDDAFSARFPISNITSYDCIIYSVGLEKTLQWSNVSVKETSQRILDGFSVIYNSGLSYIAEKSR
jgi:hypothetical protein